VPTLVEQGYDVVLSNWRGVAGPANAAPELRGRLEELIARLHASAPWRAALDLAIAIAFTLVVYVIFTRGLSLSSRGRAARRAARRGRAPTTA
jgi:hypothetical protein